MKIRMARNYYTVINGEEKTVKSYTKKEAAIMLGVATSKVYEKFNLG